jgi:hypothetical protein
LYWTDSGSVDGAKRYIGCIDADGNRHDYGFTFVNTMAIASGLAPKERAKSILEWLDHGHSVDGKGVRRSDIYTFKFAPRCNTIDNTDWWPVGWPASMSPWGDQIQNGGADLYESYYDIIARLKTRGADDAYRRFMDVMRRYAEPDRLTGGRPLFTGESVQGGTAGGAGGTGIMTSEFPESSLLAAVLVYGFLGADARADGLHIHPQIPSDQPFIRAENIYYHGAYLDIQASKSELAITVRPCENRFDFTIGGKLMRAPFTWKGPNREMIIQPIRRVEGKHA